jgi:hypothetical protein
MRGAMRSEVPGGPTRTADHGKMAGAAEVSAMVVSGHGKPLLTFWQHGRLPPRTGLVSTLGATDEYGGIYQESSPTANRPQDASTAAALLVG